MREIKFRAWVEEEKGMFPCSSPWMGNVMVQLEPGLLKAYPESEIKVMQFTGLHDKNGVEIFEGDILKGNLLDPEQMEIVCWNDSLGGFDPFGFGEGYEFDESYSVVIGNIHQNQEVLKEKIP